MWLSSIWPAPWVWLRTINNIWEVKWNVAGIYSSPRRSAGSENRPKLRKKSRRGILFIILAVLIVAGGIFYWRSTFTEDTDDAQINGHLIQVSARINGTGAQDQCG